MIRRAAEGYIGKPVDLADDTVSVFDPHGNAGFFRALAEDVPQIVFSASPSGAIEYFNRRWFAYTGQTPIDARGLGYCAAIHPDDIPALRDRWLQALRTGQCQRAEARYRRYDGAYRWHTVTVTPHRDANGAIAHWIGTITDVNQEREIDRSFRALAETVPVLVWSARADGVVDYYNSRWSGVVTDTGVLIAEGWTSIVDPADFDNVQRLWKEACETGKPCDITFRMKMLDGSYRTHRARGLPQLGDDGRILRWHGVTVDVQDEIDASERLANVNLEANLIREVSRHTPTLLFTLDVEGCVTFVNDRWASVIGVPESTLLKAGWHAFVHPEDLERVKALWLVHAGSGAPYKAQWRLLRADGTYRWIEIRAEAERLADGRIGRWFGVGIDIDEYRRALDSLELLVESGASIAREHDVTKVLRRLALAALGGVADISIFDLLDDDGGTRLVVVGANVSEESAAAVRAHGPPDLSSNHPISRAIVRRESVVVSSVDDNFIRAAVGDDVRRQDWVKSGMRSFVSVPLLVGDRAIGALTLLRTQTDNPFQPSDVRILEEVARRAAVAIENIRLNEAARRESLDRSEQFRRIADLSPQFMWTADTSGGIDWWNKRWYEFSGQTVQDSLGFGSGGHTHPDDLGAVMNAWKTALANGSAFAVEARIRGADGKYRWFFVRALPERDASGTIVKWYGSTSDIHESRRAAMTMRVFADLGEALSETLGLEETLRAILSIVVPTYAQWGYISLAGDGGQLRVAAVAHPDPLEQEKLDAVVGQTLADRDVPVGSPEVLRSRTPMLVHQTDRPNALTFVRPNVARVFEAAGFASVMICPLLVGSEPRGTLVLCMSDAARSFDPDDVPFFQELARRVVPAIANAELYERERRVAKSFQEAALPAELPLCDGFEFDAIYEAGHADALVGGDWYDAFVLQDGRIVLSIGDVAGSGLEAAVIMANVRQAIRGVAQVHADPELMLEAADRALRSENPDRFVTAFVGVIDPLERTIAFQSAGHPPPLLCGGDGICEELTSSGLPLGLRTDDEPSTKFSPLSEGTVLVLYTDGLIESTHDLSEGERRLREAVSSAKVMDGPHPAQRLHDAVLTEGSRDDVAILTVRIGSLAQPMRWAIDARDVHETGKARRSMVDALRSRGLHKAALASAELILAELVANIARYAPGDAELALEWNGTVPVLHALDSGPGFEFAAKLPQDLFSESGRGLFLIAKLSHDFYVVRRPGGGSHARVVLKSQ